MVACGSSLSHNFIGNVGSTEQKPAIRWFLYVCMALSARLRLCSPAGVNCRSICSFDIYSFSSLDTSLSMNCSFGLNPRSCSNSVAVLYALSSWNCVLDGIGTAVM